MLGQSDDRPNDPAYYIEDCRILGKQIKHAIPLLLYFDSVVSFSG